MTRKERLLSTITKEMKGLEIGPSINPIVPKREGYCVETIDHTDKQGLVEKYLTDLQSQGKIDQIEEVDYVWKGGSYLELTQKPSYYDYIIACHVIEHTVDMIGFLLDCEQMLKENGQLILAVPDKRFSFDLYKPVTTTGQLLDAYERNASFHSYGSVVDHFFHAVNGGIRISPQENKVTDCWGNYNVREDTLVYPKHTIEDVKPVFEMAKKQEKYVDIHRFVFTPSSFALIMHELSLLSVVSFEVDSISSAIGYEFIVKLRKICGEKKALPDANEEMMKRFSLMKKIRQEEAQSEFFFQEVKTHKCITNSLAMQYVLDECKLCEHELFVRGWAFLEGKDCDLQKVYLSVTDKKGNRHFYPLVKTLRPDVTMQTGDTRYELSGFIGFITLHNTQDFYLEKDDLDLFISFDENAFIGNEALSRYHRLLEPRPKKMARKLLKKT